MTPDPMTDLLSLRQAARSLGIADRALRQAVRSGEVPAYRIGERTLRVKRSDLDDWLKSRRVQPWSPRKRD